jgi:hypothetical protein
MLEPEWLGSLLLSLTSVARGETERGRSHSQERISCKCYGFFLGHLTTLHHLKIYERIIIHNELETWERKWQLTSRKRS